MSIPDRLTMSGQVWGLAAADAAGPVFATSYAGSNLAATILTAVDPAGNVIWQREFEGRPAPPRATSGGTV